MNALAFLAEDQVNPSGSFGGSSDSAQFVKISWFGLLKALHVTWSRF